MALRLIAFFICAWTLAASAQADEALALHCGSLLSPGISWTSISYKNFKNVDPQLQTAIVNGVRPALVEFQRELMVRRASATQMRKMTVRFNGQDYRVIAELGGGMEAHVLLVDHQNSLVVIKEYYESDTVYEQAPLYRHLEFAGVRAVRLLGEDLENRKIMLSYEPGLTLHDILVFVREKHMPVEILEAFRFFHEVFETALKHKIGDLLFEVTGKRHYFNPHPENVVFNPKDGTWTVIDPH